uniref:Uncharacterized protein n=1 Tax=Arundo donax TaxID=35708 RepID=A0A0A9B8V1_ARUDO
MQTSSSTSRSSSLNNFRGIYMLLPSACMPELWALSW